MCFDIPASSFLRFVVATLSLSFASLPLCLRRRVQPPPDGRLGYEHDDRGRSGQKADGKTAEGAGYRDERIGLGGGSEDGLLRQSARARPPTGPHSTHAGKQRRQLHLITLVR